MIEKLIIRPVNINAAETSLMCLKTGKIILKRLDRVLLLEGNISEVICKPLKELSLPVITNTINQLHSTFALPLDTLVTYIQIGGSFEITNPCDIRFLSSQKSSATKNNDVSLKFYQHTINGKHNFHYSLSLMYPGNIPGKRHCYTVEDFVKNDAHKKLIKRWLIEFEKLTRRMRLTSLTASQLYLLNELQQKINRQQF